MTSVQHNLLRLTLNSASFALKYKKIDIQTLRNLLDLTTVWMLLPWGVFFEKVRIGGPLKGEWIRPERYDPDHVMLYLHGGGYALGSSHTHRAMVGQIAKESGIPALLVAYRKIPESACPAAIEDAVAGYEYLLEQGYKPENIIIGGDSAGGGLAITMQLALREKGLPLPAGSILLSPWVDLAVTGKSVYRNFDRDPLVRVDEMKKWGRIYAGSRSLTDPSVSPLYADLTGLPPMLIQVSRAEVLHDDAMRLAEVARNAGVEVTLQEWDGLMHWWHLFWHVLPEAKNALHKITEFEYYDFKRSASVHPQEV